MADGNPEGIPPDEKQTEQPKPKPERPKEPSGNRRFRLTQNSATGCDFEASSIAAVPLLKSRTEIP